MDLPGTKSEAQRRVDRIRAFRAELRQLQHEGALELSPEQELKLRHHLDQTLGELAARFDVDVTESEKRISWGMRIASTLGGLALCAAVVLFFYRIWGLLAIPVQVAVLIATPLIAIAAMEFTARRERTYYYTALLGTVAFAAAVLNLNALAAMFNVTPSPNGFLVWSVFGFALAYAYRLRLLLAAGIVCGVLFAAMTLTRAAGTHWQEMRPETVLIGGALVALVPFVVRHSPDEGFPWVYRLLGLFTMLFAMFILSMNGRLTFLPLGRQAAEITYQIAGMGVAALAIRFGVIRGMPAIVNLGSAGFAVFLYIRLYQWWWDLMPKFLFFLIIGLIALALLYVFQRYRKQARQEQAA